MFTSRREASFLSAPPHTALPQALSDSHSSYCWPFFVVVASTIAVPCADTACSLYASTGSVSLLPPWLFRHHCLFCPLIVVGGLVIIPAATAVKLQSLGCFCGTQKGLFCCVFFFYQLDLQTVIKWQLVVGNSRYGLMVPSPPYNSCTCSLTPEKVPVSFITLILGNKQQQQQQFLPRT